MTARKLLAQLAALPPDTLILLARDPEGNGYSPLDEISTGFVWEDEDIWDTDLPAYEVEAATGMSEAEWEEFKTSHPQAAVLWPTY